MAAGAEAEAVVVVVAVAGGAIEVTPFGEGDCVDWPGPQAATSNATTAAVIADETASRLGRRSERTVRTPSCGSGEASIHPNRRAGHPGEERLVRRHGRSHRTREVTPGIICSVIEEPTIPLDGGPSACPFIAFEDDRDHRSSSPDYRHRCFAAPEPEPRAFPHQERYCLSPDFARCPIFLDWARQEAAAVKVAGAAAAGSGAVAAADAAAAALIADDDESGPAFLAGRPRIASGSEASLASRRDADVATSLWSYEGEGKRSNVPAAPPPPSSLGTPAIAMARRGPSHPGWETPPRLENFPRLRSREERRANQPLLFAAIGMAVLMVALALFPIVTSKGGTAAGSGSGGLGGSGSGLIATSPSPSVSPSTASGPTFFQYTVRSGDQMWAIAKYFNILLPDLVAANPQVKDPGHLEIGWILNIPPPGWQATASPGAASPT